PFDALLPVLLKEPSILGLPRLKRRTAAVEDVPRKRTRYLTIPYPTFEVRREPSPVPEEPSREEAPDEIAEKTEAEESLPSPITIASEPTAETALPAPNASEEVEKVAEEESQDQKKSLFEQGAVFEISEEETPKGQGPPPGFQALKLPEAPPAASPFQAPSPFLTPPPAQAGGLFAQPPPVEAAPEPPKVEVIEDDEPSAPKGPPAPGSPPDFVPPEVEAWSLAQANAVLEACFDLEEQEEPAEEPAEQPAEEPLQEVDDKEEPEEGDEEAEEAEEDDEEEEEEDDGEDEDEGEEEEEEEEDLEHQPAHTPRGPQQPVEILEDDDEADGQQAQEWDKWRRDLLEEEPDPEQGNDWPEEEEEPEPYEEPEASDVPEVHKPMPVGLVASHSPGATAAKAVATAPWHRQQDKASSRGRTTPQAKAGKGQRSRKGQTWNESKAGGNSQGQSWNESKNWNSWSSSSTSWNKWNDWQSNSGNKNKK
ncbi:unnamed protein product, partial [Symbiodinium pilosum]